MKEKSKITHQWQVTNEEDLMPVIEYIIPLLNRYKMLLLTGGLGAGKTTTVRHLIHAMGSHDEVNSPSYSLINEYQINDQKSVYHMDMYRLNSIDEALDIGIEEYLYSNQLCIIEWPDLIMDLVDQTYLALSIHIDEQGVRTFTLRSSD